eukprot:COSAG02_NODE_21690_length_778_cov_1.238586_2_plen_130_part_01
MEYKKASMVASTSVWNIISVGGVTMREAVDTWWGQSTTAFNTPSGSASDPYSCGDLQPVRHHNQMDDDATPTAVKGRSLESIPPQCSKGERCPTGVQCPACDAETCYCPTPADAVANNTQFITDCVWHSS